MSDEFDFLRQKKDSKEKEIDWGQVKEEWLYNLNSLMDNINSWIEGPKNEGLITVLNSLKQIEEENLGRYNAPSLRLLSQGKHLNIEPEGRLFFGCSGKVKFISGKGEREILKIKEKWIINDKSQNKPEFTRDAFIQIMKWALTN